MTQWQHGTHSRQIKMMHSHTGMLDVVLCARNVPQACTPCLGVQLCLLSLQELQVSQVVFMLSLRAEAWKDMHLQILSLVVHTNERTYSFVISHADHNQPFLTGTKFVTNTMPGAVAPFDRLYKTGAPLCKNCQHFSTTSCPFVHCCWSGHAPQQVTLQSSPGDLSFHIMKSTWRLQGLCQAQRDSSFKALHPGLQQVSTCSVCCPSNARHMKA